MIEVQSADIIDKPYRSASAGLDRAWVIGIVDNAKLVLIKRNIRAEQSFQIMNAPCILSASATD